MRYDVMADMRSFYGSLVTRLPLQQNMLKYHPFVTTYGPTIVTKGASKPK